MKKILFLILSTFFFHIQLIQGYPVIFKDSDEAKEIDIDLLKKSQTLSNMLESVEEAQDPIPLEITSKTGNFIFQELINLNDNVLLQKIEVDYNKNSSYSHLYEITAALNYLDIPTIFHGYMRLMTQRKILTSQATLDRITKILPSFSQNDPVFDNNEDEALYELIKMLRDEPVLIDDFTAVYLNHCVLSPTLSYEHNTIIICTCFSPDNNEIWFIDINGNWGKYTIATKKIEMEPLFNDFIQPQNTFESATFSPSKKYVCGIVNLPNNQQKCIVKKMDDKDAIFFEFDFFVTLFGTTKCLFSYDDSSLYIFPLNNNSRQMKYSVNLTNQTTREYFYLLTKATSYDISATNMIGIALEDSAVLFPLQILHSSSWVNALTPYIQDYKKIRLLAEEAVLLKFAHNSDNFAIVGGSRNHPIYTYNATDKSLDIHNLPVTNFAWINDIDFSPDNSKIAVCSEKKCLIWDIVTKKVQNTINLENLINTILFASTGFSLLFTTENNFMTKKFFLYRNTKNLISILQSMKPSPTTPSKITSLKNWLYQNWKKVAGAIGITGLMGILYKMRHWLSQHQQTNP